MPFWSQDTPAQSASQSKTPTTEWKMLGGAEPQIHSFAWKKKRSSPCLFFPQHFPISRRPLPGTTFYSFVIISHRTKTMLCLASQAGGFVLPLLKQSYWLSFWPCHLGIQQGYLVTIFFFNLLSVFCYFILREIAQKLNSPSRGISPRLGRGSDQAAGALSFKSTR